MSKPHSIRKLLASYLTHPVVRLLAKTPLTPNAITWLGFLITLVAGGLILSHHLLAAGLVVLLAGFFDILDGALARYTDQASRFGTVLDSTLDRLSEAVLLITILVMFLTTGNSHLLIISRPWAAVLTALALLGSLLVSYIRARAETQGLECQVGFFTRSERVIVLALGLMLSSVTGALVVALGIIATFSYVTAGQRLWHVWQQTKNDEPRGE